MIKTSVKRGSKKKNSGQWDKRIAFYMSAELYEKIEKMAKLTGMTESSYVRSKMTTLMENIP